jgi:hypothetical protein
MKSLLQLFRHLLWIAALLCATLLVCESQENRTFMKCQAELTKHQMTLQIRAHEYELLKAQPKY